VSSFDAAKDIIDLSHIDADLTTPGVQNFTFIGQAPFDGAEGEVRYQLNPTNDRTYVEAALAGDTSADFTITLSGLFALTAANFALTASQSSADLADGAALTYSRVQTAAGAPTDMRLLFSAHGLPERISAKGDPYRWQVEQSCAAIAARLGGGWDWRVCYQSRVGPLKWIGPSTIEAIEQAALDGLGVVVAPVAFVSEHVETLVELDRDYAEVAEKVGAAPYLRVPALGCEPLFIEGLAALVEAALARPAGIAPGAGTCPAAYGRCALRAAEAAA